MEADKGYDSRMLRINVLPAKIFPWIPCRRKKYATSRNADGKWKEGFRGYRENFEESIFIGSEKWSIGLFF